MFTLKTGTATHYDDAESKQTLLAVPFEILQEFVDENGEKLVDQDGNELSPIVVQAMSESFDLNATAEDIKAVLHRHLNTFTEDHERHAASQAAQAARDASAQEAEKISNIKL